MFSSTSSHLKYGFRDRCIQSPCVNFGSPEKARLEYFQGLEDQEEMLFASIRYLKPTAHVYVLFVRPFHMFISSD